MPQFCSTGHRVLVAEDNTTNSLVMKTILERAGYRCTLARNGEQALDRLVHEPFDAAALDVHMPIMTGLEAAKALRFMRPGTPRLPLVLFSAESGSLIREECLRAGADEFLPKPIQVASFLETIARVVAVHWNCAQGRQGGVTRQDPARFPAVAGSECALDYATLGELEHISPDPAFLDGLLAGFMQDNGLLLEKLGLALTAGRLHDALDLLHALKGSAVSIGAVALKSSCQRFERHLLTGQQNGHAALGQAVSADYRVLCAAIQSYRGTREQRLVAEPGRQCQAVDLQ